MCRITVITSLYNCQQYLRGYFEAIKKIENKDEIEILLIHNSPTDEEMAIVNGFLSEMTFIRHIIIEREGLYATWNRGVALAKGDYITTWNVDDVRLPNSLREQADSLDNNSRAALSYGDFIIVNNYGSTNGKQVNEPQFDPSNRTFYRQHHIGCFPMWRKSIHETIGYFDEQFRLIADLDFQIRIARKYRLIKISTQLGFYLEGTPANLSSNFDLQDKEHTVLHLRFGNFNLLYFTHLLNGLNNFKVFKHKWFGEYHNLTSWTSQDRFQYASRFPLVLVSVFNFPRHFARRYLKPYFSKLNKKNLTVA
ncbi:MAG: glycosyltransferase [Chitinophagaceae bacterium]